MVTEFTPWSALLGGILIGLAATCLMLLYGRIAGISGILSRLLPPVERSGFGGRLGFVGGLISAPVIWWLGTGQAVKQMVSGSLPLVVAAGLLVGFGSVYGNGCTSGHGVCGLSRLSARSFVAVAVFMGVAALTVFLIRHALGG